MGRTETYTKLLDRCSTPVQTDIILAQLKLLRRQDRERNLLRERIGMATPAMVLLIVSGVLIWAMMSAAVALHLATVIPFGH